MWGERDAESRVRRLRACPVVGGGQAMNEVPMLPPNNTHTLSEHGFQGLLSDSVQLLVLLLLLAAACSPGIWLYWCSDGPDASMHERSAAVATRAAPGPGAAPKADNEPAAASTGTAQTVETGFWEVWRRRWKPAPMAGLPSQQRWSEPTTSTSETGAITIKDPPGLKRVGSGYWHEDALL